MQISWFPTRLIPTGRLGLCHIPGGADTPTSADLQALSNANVALVVCLVEEEEFFRLEPPETLRERRLDVEALGMQLLHHPIEDFEAPSPNGALRIVTRIQQVLDSNGIVVVHCWAGLGRAGTIAACVLRARGMGADDAIVTVRWVREGAIQSEAQEQLIASFPQSDVH